MPTPFETLILPGVPVSLFWLFVGIGVILQGVSKSGFAGGAGILSVPLMMLVMPPDKVVGMLLPLLVMCDINAIYFYRRQACWKHVWAIYLPSIAGTVLATAVWWWVGSDGINHWKEAIKQFVGVIAILFVLYIVGKGVAQEWMKRLHPGPRSAVWFGLVAGFTSSIAHAAGPVVGLYLFAQDLGKTLFVGTTAWTFFLINTTKLPFFYSVGLFKRDVLLLDLSLLALVPIGSYLGKWMHHRVNETWFNRIILILTLVAGVQLVFRIDLVQSLYRSLLTF